TGGRESPPPPSAPFWLSIYRARSTHASLTTTSRRVACLRSAAFTSSRPNEASLRHVPRRSRNRCCGSTVSPEGPATAGLPSTLLAATTLKGHSLTLAH